MDLSWKEFQYNLLFEYGMKPQDIPIVFDGFRNWFSMDHALFWRRGGFDLELNDDVEKEWSVLGAQGLSLSCDNTRDSDLQSAS